jgi:CO dehydrogenase maturation factor
MCDDPLHIDGEGHHDHGHSQNGLGLPPDQTEGLRVVIAGKGGVGKSTIAALLARHLARRGAAVVAVDGDEQSNLGAALGLHPDVAAALVPLSAQAEYVEEKTGAQPGEGAGALLRLSPDVSDVLDRMAVPSPDGVRLLVMGGVARAGGGCLCPETALLAATVRSMRLRAGEVVVMDTHAGVEHFGRSLALGFDEAVVVVDPTRNAAAVGLTTARLASELGMASVRLVINRVREPADAARVRDYLGLSSVGLGAPFSALHLLPYDEEALSGEASVERLLGGSPLGDAVSQLAGDLYRRAG